MAEMTDYRSIYQALDCLENCYSPNLKQDIELILRFFLVKIEHLEKEKEYFRERIQRLENESVKHAETLKGLVEYLSDENKRRKEGE